MMSSGSNSSNDQSNSSEMSECTVVLRDDRGDVQRLQSSICEQLSAIGYDESASFAVRLSLEEALANGFRHGNQSNPEKSVTVVYRISPNEVTITVEDQGSGFDPDAVPDPTDEANLEIPSGRGIMLIRAYMTDVQIIPPGNRLEMMFRRPA